MSIIFGYPPNIADIVERFPAIKGRTDIAFAYAPHIYLPSGRMPHPALEAHEKVHIKRQGVDPRGWWRCYMDVREFRFDEEAYAHAAEYLALIDGKPRFERRLILRETARKMLEPIYERMTQIGEAAALKAIKGCI